MANYVTSRKQFKAFGCSYIELADINIDKITVNIDNKKVDRTNFLKYGQLFNSISTVNCVYIEKQFTTSIVLENNEYYFNYTDIDISINDKIILSNMEDINNNMVYCIVKNIIKEKIYINYYTETNNVIKTYNNIKLIKYEDIKESINNEFFINDELNNKKLIIPIFLPIIIDGNSLVKQILIHINNNIKKCDIIFLPKENNFINNLTKNNFYEINHNTIKNSDYTTYITSFIYNGRNVWFSN